MIGLLHSDAVIRGIVVSRELDPDLPKILGDRIQLQQVLLNLLLNAFDAMRDGPPRDRVVDVRSRHGRLGGSGHGERSRPRHSPEDMDKLFEPFRSTKPGGLGMGLSISRSIVASHGGRMWAENNTTRGATFGFSLPVHVESMRLIGVPHMNERAHTVFVVDDDASVRKSLVRLLKSMGYPARPYASAREFLDDWRDDPAAGLPGAGCPVAGVERARAAGAAPWLGAPRSRSSSSPATATSR